ncbi:MAG: hypothetical protein IJ015_05095 [Ruminococcus sp.]|nr:hypothetical protein [Ruminococcus sp.]
MTENTRTQNSIKNASSEVIGRLTIAGSKFILRTVFIYTLGIQYNGIAGLFNDVLFMFSLAELGISSAISFALYKPIANKDEDAIVRIMKFYKIVYRIIAGVIMLLGIFMLPFLQYLVKDVPDIKESIHLIFMLFVIQSASSYLFVYKATLLEANQQKRVVSFVNMITAIIQTVVESVILIVFKEYLLYLVFSIIFTLGKNITISKLAEKQFPVLKKKNVGPLTKLEAKQIKSDIGATAIYNISDVVVQTTDTIVAAAFFPTTIVGVLSNYRLVINTLNTLISQVSSSCVPSIGNLAVSATAKRMKKLYDQVSFLMFMVGNFVCAALIGLLNPFVGNIWLSNEYLLISPTVIVVVFNLYLCIMQYPNSAYRKSNGLFVQGRMGPAIMTLLNVVLSVIFATYFSRFGAQWGVFGILLATPLARLVTETWFDPYVVYKYVFKEKMVKYFLTRLIYFVVAVVSCFATHFSIQSLINVLSVRNVYLDFLLRVCCVCIVPNVIMLLVFFKTKVFKESVGMVLKAVLKRKKK